MVTCEVCLGSSRRGVWASFQLKFWRWLSFEKWWVLIEVSQFTSVLKNCAVAAKGLVVLPSHVVLWLCWAGPGWRLIMEVLAGKFSGGLMSWWSSPLLLWGACVELYTSPANFIFTPASVLYLDFGAGLWSLMVQGKVAVYKYLVRKGKNSLRGCFFFHWCSSSGCMVGIIQYKHNVL